jgi:hypothetical protein
MSLGIATFSRPGVVVGTDSAMTTVVPGEDSQVELSGKTWRLSIANVMISVCGSVRIPPPPNSWPRPAALAADGGCPPFKKTVQAVAEQMSTGKIPGDDDYELLLAGGPDDSPPQLAKVSLRRGIEWGLVGSVFTAGAANFMGPNGSLTAPGSLTSCADLVISLAAQTIRDYRETRNPHGGPAVAWPLHVYTWSGSLLPTAPSKRTVQEDAGLSAEIRYFAAIQEAAMLSGWRGKISAAIETRLETEHWRPEDVALIKADPPKIEITPVNRQPKEAT